MEEMLIKYNEKYDRWCRSDGKIYRQDKDGKFIECKQSKLKSGYLHINVSSPKRKRILSHRLIWETLKGLIHIGYEIDHINTIRWDNRLANLRCVTHAENMNNHLSIINHRGKNPWNAGKITSEFGRKFYEHFGIAKYQNEKLYQKEYMWYHAHNKKCRWEV